MSKDSRLDHQCPDLIIKVKQDKIIQPGFKSVSPADKETQQYDACIANNLLKSNNIQKVILTNPSILKRRISNTRDSKVEILTGGSSRMRGKRARTVPRGERLARAGPTRYGSPS